jgi:tetratricopeptide (TPR) repeat protein
LLARDALGASDLGQALAYLAERPEGHERLLVVGDGVVTAGADDLTSLREAVAKLAAHGVRRLDVIAEGGVRDDDTLAALTRAGLASTGVWLDARMTESTWVEKLRRRVADEVSVNLAGATWIEPRAFEAVQVGDERLVFAELPPGTPVQIELGDGSAVALPVLEAPRPLLERAMARAKIAAFTRELNTLRERDEAKRAALQSRIVALSVKQRVLSELTGLLVLETDADYRRFGIAQTALTDILHVGDEGLALMHRAPPLPTRVLERADAEESLDDAVGMVQEGAAPEAPSVARGEAPSGPAQDRASKMPSASAIAQAKKPALRARHATSPSSQAPVSKSAPAPRAAPRAPEPAASGIAMGESPALSSRKGSAAVDAADGLGSGAVVTERRSSGMLIAAQPTWTASVRVRSASGVGSASAQRVLSGRLRSEALRCYSRARAEETDALLRLELGVDARGRVVSVDVPRALSDAAATRCVSEAARRVQLEKPEGGSASLLVEIVFRPSVTPPPDQVDSRPVSPRPRPRPVVARREPALEDAYEGVLAEVLSALRSGDGARALEIAERAHRDDPADVIALVALGEALEARGDRGRAARVYGSLIDLFPARADLRRMAGARLERLGDAGVKLAVDSYRRALAQRPDHPSSHRLHAFSLLAQGRASEAFAALETALGTPFNEERFPGVSRLLREDLGLAGAAWLRLSPQAKERIEQALSQHGAELPTKPSLRFVLSWETDANDVDFHIYDGRGGHASYMNKRLGSGGELFADITTGYGPECFAIAGAPRAFPYTLEAHYFARGPMGYGMGKLQIVQHDGKGALAFAEHPFVIMKDKAFIRLARLDKSLL